jgi:uncharacterized protein YoxC
MELAIIIVASILFLVIVCIALSLMQTIDFLTKKCKILEKSFEEMREANFKLIHKNKKDAEKQRV